MNLNEAYKTLEVQDSISDEDLKKHYKKLATKYHPDLYKEDPNKFKVINEAYQTVQKYRENGGQDDDNFQGFGGFGDISNFINFQDIFQQVNSHNTHHQPPIINIDLSFKESILGCEKEIEYQAYRKCEECSGGRYKVEGNGCDNCDGFGYIIQSNGNMTMKSFCNKCKAKGVKKTKCQPCNGEGAVLKSVGGKMQMQPGLPDGVKIKLSGHGHYVGSSFMGDSHTDVIVSVSVEKTDNMKLDGNDVVSELELSLFDAVKGKELEVETVYGKKKIVVPGKSKNKEEINIEKCGVANTSGVHKLVLNVKYPGNIEEFVDLVKE